VVRPHSAIKNMDWKEATKGEDETVREVVREETARLAVNPSRNEDKPQLHKGVRVRSFTLGEKQSLPWKEIQNRPLVQRLTSQTSRARENRCRRSSPREDYQLSPQQCMSQRRDQHCTPSPPTPPVFAAINEEIQRMKLFEAEAESLKHSWQDLDNEETWFTFVVLQKGIDPWMLQERLSPLGWKILKEKKLKIRRKKALYAMCIRAQSDRARELTGGIFSETIWLNSSRVDWNFWGSDPWLRK